MKNQSRKIFFLFPNLLSKIQARREFENFFPLRILETSPMFGTDKEIGKEWFGKPVPHRGMVNQKNPLNELEN